MLQAARGGSLQSLMDEKRDLVDYFYNDTQSRHLSKASTAKSGVVIPPEFTNWRDEQNSWRDAAALFDQCHHMPELFLEGPDAQRLLSDVAINSFSNFGPGRAKQMVVCSERGFVIGDCVLYYHGPESFELVSGMTCLNWVQFQAESKGYDVSITRDDPTLSNPTGRRVKYRFQLDGPRAGDIFAELVDGEAPEVPFFRTAQVTVRGRPMTVLRHGMAGHKGAEFSGPYEDMEFIRAAILEVGEKYGLMQCGTKTYFSTLVESGWMAYPLPGIYTGEDMRAFREWLPNNGWEANAQLGGSYVSNNIEDYYVTPFNIGYDKILKFDHDFIGREALEAIAGTPQRQRVTLVWNPEDLAKVFSSQFGDGPRYKAMELPVTYYGFPHFDEVKDGAGNLVGLSCHCGYSNNEGAFLSLAMMDPSHAEPGTEVVVTWGEPNGGSRKAHVERHEQTTVRAVVAPVPYAAAVRLMKRQTI